jgi:hypothetical protein
MTLGALLVEVVRVSWTLAHDESNDAVDRIIQAFFQQNPQVHMRDEQRKAVTIVVPIDPM